MKANRFYSALILVAISISVQVFSTQDAHAANGFHRCNFWCLIGHPFQFKMCRDFCKSFIRLPQASMSAPGQFERSDALDSADSLNGDYHVDSSADDEILEILNEISSENLE